MHFLIVSVPFGILDDPECTRNRFRAQSLADKDVAAGQGVLKEVFYHAPAAYTKAIVCQDPLQGSVSRTLHCLWRGLNQIATELAHVGIGP